MENFFIYGDTKQENKEKKVNNTGIRRKIYNTC